MERCICRAMIIACIRPVRKIPHAYRSDSPASSPHQLEMSTSSTEMMNVKIYPWLHYVTSNHNRKHKQSQQKTHPSKRMAGACSAQKLLDSERRVDLCISRRCLRGYIPASSNRILNSEWLLWAMKLLSPCEITGRNDGPVAFRTYSSLQRICRVPILFERSWL